MEKFLKYCDELGKDIAASYEGGTTLDQAEKLAANFLSAQLLVVGKMHAADMDARMRKVGVKAIRSAVYMDAATTGDKKPSDVFIEAKVNLDALVQTEQKSFDEAEAYKDALYNYYNVFREAHIYYRGISRGSAG
jgi:hypothetical protein